MYVSRRKEMELKINNIGEIARLILIYERKRVIVLHILNLVPRSFIPHLSLVILSLVGFSLKTYAKRTLDVSFNTFLFVEINNKYYTIYNLSLSSAASATKTSNLLI